MAGTGLYFGLGEHALHAIAEELRIPVFLNGLGRGCLPADHELALLPCARERPQGRGRRAGDRRADGLPPGLRRVVRRGHQADRRSTRRHAASGPTRARWSPSWYGGVPATLDALREGRRAGRDRSGWIGPCARRRTRSAPASTRSWPTPARPLHPMRVYAELAKVLERNAIVIGDGGDFVSYAGRDDRDLRARLLDGPGALRMPRRRPGLRARRQARASRSAGLPAAGRRRLRLRRAWSSTPSSATAYPWWA